MSVSNSTLSRPSLEETARKLCESRGGKWSGTKGMARCPAHDDRTPSLGVTLGRKAILLHCFAGCDQASVLAALAREGIETSALFSGSSDEFPIQPSYSGQPSAAALRTRPDISEFFAAQTGVQDWGSAWTIDDFNNAVEIGALLWLREFSRVDLNTGFHQVAARFDWLEAALPPRHVRSESQVELQQFSTPPILGWLMAKAASLGTRDHVLEPSAGNGALALWGDVRGCSLTLNEIDRARRDALALVFPDARLSAHDGELIVELAKGPSPSVILMNPPFARSRERGVDGRTAMRHLRSALRICAPGGRLVAILPDGFDAATFVEDQEQASLLLNIRLSGAFSRSGTGIAVRMVVIEKADLQDNSTISEEFADLAELNCCLVHLPNRVFLQAKVHRLRAQWLAR